MSSSKPASMATSPSAASQTFNPGLDADLGANSITLPYTPEGGVLAAGDKVRYYAGGGAPMGGLSESLIYNVKTGVGLDEKVFAIPYDQVK